MSQIVENYRAVHRLTHYPAIEILEQPVASGSTRDVFRHPTDRSLLIKVNKAAPSPRRFFRRWSVLKAVRRVYKNVVPLRRELGEYSRMKAYEAETKRHLQRFSHLVMTDRGVGLVVRASRRLDGTLALTLRKIIQLGIYDKAIDTRMREFLDWYEKSGIVAADVHLDNIVFDETLDSIVLIDGIGDKTFIPLRAWFPIVNKLYKRSRARKIRDEIAYRFMDVTLRKDALRILLWIVGVSLGIDLIDGQLIDG
ncbi:YrbL family protein [Neorhizobium sp. DAR64860/K0K1]|uniref:YrbL family protein n=1 Tax=Neorhizobium sp. DAR64860/K0K1 TaxID=3421955 RepID=UPI003D2AD210